MGTTVSTKSAASAIPASTGSGAASATEATSRAPGTARNTAIKPIAMDWASSVTVRISPSSAGATRPSRGPACATVSATTDTATTAAGATACTATNPSAPGAAASSTPFTGKAGTRASTAATGATGATTAGTAAYAPRYTTNLATAATVNQEDWPVLSRLATGSRQDSSRCAPRPTANSITCHWPGPGSGSLVTASGCVCYACSCSWLPAASAEPSSGRGVTDTTSRASPRLHFRATTAATQTDEPTHCATPASGRSPKRPTSGWCVRRSGICASYCTRLAATLGRPRAYNAAAAEPTTRRRYNTDTFITGRTS